LALLIDRCIGLVLRFGLFIALNSDMKMFV